MAPYGVSGKTTWEPSFERTKYFNHVENGVWIFSRTQWFINVFIDSHLLAAIPDDISYPIPMISGPELENSVE